MMPVQNTGRLTPVTATAMLSLSSQEYCRVAETMPATSPRVTAMARAPAVRITVALKRRSTSGSTSRPSGIERPRSPWTTRPIHWRYWSATGRSRPEVAAQALHVLPGGLGAQHDGGRIARGEAHDPEDEQRDPDQDGQRQQDAADDVALEAGPSYCSHTCVSTRSKFGWSLNPCTRLR